MADEIEEMRALGAELRDVDARRDEILARRRELTLKAREAGITWRALAEAVGMTQHGLIKATNSEK
ncbi:hypothetical protein [Subtercola boreus]|nr:hypothetical protein [Subtercola boreus]